MNPFSGGIKGSRRDPRIKLLNRMNTEGIKAKIDIRSTVTFPVRVRLRLGLTPNRTVVSVTKLT